MIFGKEFYWEAQIMGIISFFRKMISVICAI